MSLQPGILICKKDDPDIVFTRGEIYITTSTDSDFDTPIVELPTDTNQNNVGVCVQDSPEGDERVYMKFTGLAVVKYFIFFGGVIPGQSIGTSPALPFGIPNAVGVGIIVNNIIDGFFFTPGLALVKLTGSGEVITRWKEFDP